MAPCDLSTIAGFHCSDDGDSVVVAPIVVHGPLTIPESNVLVLRLDELRKTMMVNGKQQPFLDVDGNLKLGGDLILSFDVVPENDKVESWLLFETHTGPILGGFKTMRTNITSLGTLEGIAEDLCEEVNIGLLHYGTFVNLTTRRHNKCWDAAKSHPGVVAAIVLSTLGVFFTIITLFVLWRKRRFERSRAAVLSSPLAEEAELQEMRLADSKSYSEAAKMIESTSGRFEIGDDDIDDSHPEL